MIKFARTAQRSSFAFSLWTSNNLSRYAIACHLGVQLTLAYCLGHHLKSAIPFNSQRVWRFILTATLTLSLISSIAMHNASTWWNKYSSYYNPEVADQINQSDRAIVLSSVPRIIRPTSLSHHLKPETKFIFFDEEISIAFPEEATDVYVFRPLANLLEGLELQGYSVTVLHEKGKLWKVNL